MTIGTEGFILPQNTLIKEALQIINGVEPGLPIECLGFTKYEVIKFTKYVTDTKFETYHKLGVTPRLIVITTTVDPDTISGQFLRFAASMQTADGYGYASIVAKLSGGSMDTNEAQGHTSGFYSDSSKIMIKQGTPNYNFEKGVQYTLLVMA